MGHFAEREALIFCLDQLYVIPREAILGFRVERLLPA
jgi:hypothetical protein